MSKSPRYRPVVLIRRILLAVLFLFLGGVTAVFIASRLDDDVEAEPDSGGLDSALADIILTGKGFDYEVTDGQERLFHIRADRIVADRDRVVTLRGIVLTIERPSGDIYELAAEEGRYHSESNTAEVEGNVVITGPDGLELRGPKFELLRKGTVVKSRGPVEFTAADGLAGSAEEMEAYLKKDRFQMAGNVRVVRGSAESDSALSLIARRVVYDKQNELIQAEGGVKLRNGRDEMSCERIAVTLSGADSRAEFVRARWNVSGSLASDDPRGFGRRLDFTGQEISIEYGKQGRQPRRAEIVGTQESPARIDQGDETGLVRRFVTRRIEAEFTRGRVREVHTSGALTLTEFLAFDAGRELSRVCGGLARAKFSDRGDLVQLSVKRGVDLHRPGLQTTGSSLTAVGEDLIEIEGELAHIYTATGEVSSPKIAYDSTAAIVTASGGVQARFPPNGDFTMVRGGEASNDKPVQVTAETAKWSQTAGDYRFDGDVRAWQGESFLTAQSLIGENGGRVRATGGVQTILERDPAEGVDAAKRERGPVKVTAESLDYSEAEGLIKYSGATKVSDSGRNMSCGELVIGLTASSDLEWLKCSGDAAIDDRIGGRKVRGAEAFYRPGDGTVEVTGSPVTLENPDGAVIRAGRVLYDFETSSARFQSAGSSAAGGEGSGP